MPRRTTAAPHVADEAGEAVEAGEDDNEAVEAAEDDEAFEADEDDESEGIVPDRGSTECEL